MKYKIGDCFKSTSASSLFNHIDLKNYIIKIKRIICDSELPYVCEVVKQNNVEYISLIGIVFRQSENDLNGYEKLSEEESMAILI